MIHLIATVCLMIATVYHVMIDAVTAPCSWIYSKLRYIKAFLRSDKI